MSQQNRGENNHNDSRKQKNDPLKCFLFHAACRAFSSPALFTGKAISPHSITTFLIKPRNYFLLYFERSIATATAIMIPLMICCHIGLTLINCSPY